MNFSERSDCTRKPDFDGEADLRELNFVRDENGRLVLRDDYEFWSDAKRALREQYQREENGKRLTFTALGMLLTVIMLVLLG